MSKGNAGPPSPPPSSALPEAARAPASSLASEKSLNNSSRSRSRSKRWMRDEIVAVPSNTSSFPVDDHQETFHDDSEFKDLFDEKGKGSSQRRHGPIDLIYNIFTCWSHERARSGSFQHTSSRPRLNSFAAAALLEQNRLQQEALVESHDTQDMWEWEMEQQRLITCEEHDVLERNQIEMNPLLGHLVPEIVPPSGQLVRNASAHSGVEDADVHTDAASTEFSPPLDANLLQGTSSYEPELISAVVLLFEAALMRCRSEINFFCRIYMQQMVFSGYALIRTLMEMEPNTVFLKKVHTSYALESRINNALFRCFENDSFDDSGLTQIFDPGTRAAVRFQDYLRMKAVDPEDALGVHNASYDPCFHSFCANKSEEVMAMFSWNMGYRSAAERDRFMESFLRTAKWVWLLHRLANATNPPMQIIRVGRGQEVDPMYLEPVASPPMGSCQSCSASSSIPKVEFMVMPGFITPRRVFRCKVYQHYMCK